MAATAHSSSAIVPRQVFRIRCAPANGVFQLQPPIHEVIPFQPNDVALRKFIAALKLVRWDYLNLLRTYPPTTAAQAPTDYLITFSYFDENDFTAQLIETLRGLLYIVTRAEVGAVLWEIENSIERMIFTLPVEQWELVSNIIDPHFTRNLVD